MSQETRVVKVGSSAPGWLSTYAEKDTSLDAVRKYRVLARAKLLQQMSKNLEAKKAYGEGAVLMVPGDACIAKAGEYFDFVPLMFFNEFSLWKDINDGSDTPIIIDRSANENGELALKARDPKKRREPYGEKKADGTFYMRRYVESLCFPGIIYGDHPLSGSPISLSFEKGEFFNGQAFCSALMMRKVEQQPVPLWAQVWRMSPALRQKKHNWWGFKFETPEEPYIREEEGASFKQLHDDLVQYRKDQLLQIDRSDAEDEVVTTADVEAEM